MKKLLLCLLALILAALPLGGLAENINSLAVEETVGNIKDVCRVGDDLYALANSGVWRLRPDGEMIQVMNAGADLVGTPEIKSVYQFSFILPLGPTIYLFSGAHQAFYRVEDHGLAPAFPQADEIFIFEDQGETQKKAVLSAVSDGERIFLLLSSFTFDRGQLNELYMLTGEDAAPVPLGETEYTALHAAQDGRLIAGIGDGWGGGQTVMLCDPETKEETVLDDGSSPEQKGGFAWDEESRSLYYTAEGGRAYMRTAGQEPRLFGYLPVQSLYAARAFLLGKSYVLFQSPSLYVLDTEADLSKTVTLTVMGFPDEGIIRAFCLQNPGVNVQLDQRESDFLGLQSALLTGDTTMDLYVTKSDGIYLEAVQKGYAVKLTASASLTKATENYYDWAKRLLFQNGELYAVPVRAEIDHWTLNRTQWEEMKLGDYPETYGDLFRLQAAFDEAYEGDYYGLMECYGGAEGMLATVIRQYLLEHEDWTAPVDFDTAEFRSGVQDVMDHRDILEESAERMPLFMAYPQYFGTGYDDADLVESVLPPRLSDTAPQVVRGRMELMVLNPASPHQEEALKFLEFYAQHLNMETLYRLDASKTQPLRLDTYGDTKQRLEGQIAAIQAQLSAAEDASRQAELKDTLAGLQAQYDQNEERWQISAEDIAIYRAIAEKVVMPTRTVYADGLNADAINQVIHQYVDGGMALDAFIRSLNEKAKIMYLEVN